MISFLLAMDCNGLIGRGNALPWHLPDDLNYFKKLTTGHSVVMGRRTFESIGKPLPGRKNIVLTRDDRFSQPNVETFHSVEAFLSSGQAFGGECFVIGGAHVFTAFIAYADRLYLTRIDCAFEGDTFFTSFDESQWRLVSETPGRLDRKNLFPHRFQVFARRAGG